MDVAAGINTDANISWQTVLSLTRTFNAYPEDFQARLIVADGGCGDFAGNRNRLVRQFLATDVEWLLIIDTDIVWQPEDWERLRDSADAIERPYVSGLYFVDNEPLNPCSIVFGADGKKYVPLIKDDAPELARVSAACLGFGLVHRDVFFKSADPGNDHEWFEHGYRSPNGETMPEDYAFCDRVGAAGIPIYLNTKVRVGHLKQRIIGWDDYQRQIGEGDGREEG